MWRDADVLFGLSKALAEENSQGAIQDILFLKVFRRVNLAWDQCQQLAQCDLVLVELFLLYLCELRVFLPYLLGGSRGQSNIAIGIQDVFRELGVLAIEIRPLGVSRKIVKVFILFLFTFDVLIVTLILCVRVRLFICRQSGTSP